METFQEHYDSMMRTIRQHCPQADLTVINRAVDYARAKHEGQKRKDGSPYIIHPLAVAEIVAETGLDTDAILGAILHDCIEDTDSTHDEIARQFGSTVASLVEGVTKLTRVEYSTLEEQQMENLRKMFMAMSKDIRVILIKICDRLHNTRTMQFQSPAKQISKSRETMDIYAPLAHRLGMQKIKWELEDTSLKYLDPAGYDEIMQYLAEHQREADEFMKTIQTQITTRLSSVGIHGTIYGRIKHVYSIYRKMKAQDKKIDELYDMYAFRVIVDTIPDCYNVLGHIHDLFNLVPGRFKDYISTPKPNMYQSLHTTVIGQQGIPCQDGHALSIDLVVGEAAPAVVVIVHAGQIVVNQAVGMDHFHGRCKGHGLCVIPAAHPAEIHGQNGPQPLASCQEAVVRCLKNQLLGLFQEGRIDFFQVCFDFLPVQPGLGFKAAHRRAPPRARRQSRR